MKCPICKDTNLVMSERMDVEIDYCPDCRGVWLDRGELDKIVQQSLRRQNPAEPTAPYVAPYANNVQGDSSKHHGGSSSHGGYSNSHGGNNGRRKSFLERLFD